MRKKKKSIKKEEEGVSVVVEDNDDGTYNATVNLVYLEEVHEDETDNNSRTR